MINILQIPKLESDNSEESLIDLKSVILIYTNTKAALYAVNNMDELNVIPFGEELSLILNTTDNDVEPINFEKKKSKGPDLLLMKSLEHELADLRSEYEETNDVSISKGINIYNILTLKGVGADRQYTINNNTQFQVEVEKISNKEDSKYQLLLKECCEEVNASECKLIEKYNIDNNTRLEISIN